VPTWPVAAGSLVAGFAVADLTGVRPLGAIVLIAGAAWCFARWRERTNTGRAVGLVAFYAAAFAVSHVLADALTAWGSVAFVAVLTAAAAWGFGDAGTSPRPRERHEPPPPA
jgi:hypothetical protein